MSLPQISLYNTSAGSDKVYHLKIVPLRDGYVVEYANGRRLGTLQHGVKPADGKPVSLEKAQILFDSVVKEKKKGRYVEGDGTTGGPAFAGTTDAGRDSGHLPQLANPVSREDFERLLTSDDYFIQEKKDGARMALRRMGGEVEAINRRGLFVAFPKEVAQEMAALTGDFLLDGEMIGNAFWAFDALAVPADPNLATKSAANRYQALADLLQGLAKAEGRPLVHLKLVEAFFTTEKKQAHLAELLAKGCEGVVAKYRKAPYRPGRPSSGGEWLKCKFYESATVRVYNQNEQRSVGVEVLSKEAWVHIGDVTIPPNQDLPLKGELIEVRYLYAYRGGKLYQPTYLGPREDITEDACTIQQLKYKAE